jgi:hypothetical protein
MASRGSRSLFRLLAGWIGWWAILAALLIGPAIPAILRVSDEGVKGSVSVSFGDGAFSATVSEAGKVIWEGSVSFIMLVLLAGVPPLIIWGLWLRRRERPGSPDLIGEGALDAGGLPNVERAHEEQRRR